MINLVTSHQADDTKRALLSGLARASLPGGNPLVALSLVAMREKFVRPRGPIGTADSSAQYEANARYLSEASRSLLLKLVSDLAGLPDGIAFGVLRAINARGLKLHPLDYARLEDFIARYAADLGPGERAWLSQVRPERNRDFQVEGDGSLTDETLPQAGKTEKIEFIGKLRHSDPAKARQLIEALLPNEPANVRADLIRLLEINHDAGDRALLESLAQDRAQSVRDVATEILGCVRGTESYVKRIERLKDHLQIKTQGLLRKHKVLKYVGPSPETTQRALLHGLHLSDIAAALGLTEHELLEAASQSEKIGVLLLLFLIRAVKDGMLDLAASYVALLDGEVTVIEFLAETWPSASPDDRDRILRLALRPDAWKGPPIPAFFGRIFESVGTLPADLAIQLLDSPAWTDESGPAAMSWAAPLIPSTLSARFIAQAEPVASCATLYHQFLLSLPDHEP